jgi:deoxyadenosine/deoxycytidine kinase
MGNIGVGKTTVCQGLLEHFSSLNKKTIFQDEVLESNPFFKYLYDAILQQEMSIVPVANQSFFLYGRFEKEQKSNAQLENGIGIYDRSYFEQQVFNQSLFDSGKLSAENLGLLNKQLLKNYQSLGPYDIIVFLNAHPTTLMQRIKQRA